VWNPAQIQGEEAGSLGQRGRIPFYKIQYQHKLLTLLKRKRIPIGLIASLILLRSHFQERLPDKPTTDVVDCRRELLALKLLLDLCEGVLDGGLGGDISRDPDCLAAGSFDLFNDGFVIGWVAGKKGDRVGLCEFQRDRAAC
jgi:hypothetical protein